jgi:hypothetical protein
VGTTSWTTSIFPGSGGGPYVLPVKRAVRRAEDLDVGDVAGGHCGSPVSRRGGAT